MKIKSIVGIVSSGVACLSFCAVSMNAFACPVNECVTVPEPSILGLLSIGAVAIALVSYSRRNRK